MSRMKPMNRRRVDATHLADGQVAGNTLPSLRRARTSRPRPMMWGSPEST